MAIFVRFEEHSYDEGERDLVREVEKGPFEYVEVEGREIRTDQHETRPLADLSTLLAPFYYTVDGEEGEFQQYTIYTKED